VTDRPYSGTTAVARNRRWRGRPDVMTTPFRYGFVAMTRRGLRGIWVRGGPPHEPVVWAANHHSWWDPFVAAVTLWRSGAVPCLLAAQENLDRYGFARRLGAFGSSEYRLGLSYLEQGRTLIIFPEGRLIPAGPLGELAPGAAWYAERTGTPLYAVATRLVMRGHEAPEAYLSFTRVKLTGDIGRTTQRLAEQLSVGLAELDRLNANQDPREPLPGFDLIVRGRRSWDERIDLARRWWPWG